MKRWLPVTLFVVLNFSLQTARVCAKTQWICVEAKDFAVVSDAPEKDARLLAVKLEAFRSVLSRIFGLRRNSDRPLTVMAFKNWDSFQEVESSGLAVGEFIRREEFPTLEIEYDNLTFDKNLKVSRVAAADLNALYGNIMLNAMDYERRHDWRSISPEEKFKVDSRRRADTYFRQALSLDPKCARAYEGLAYLDILRENYKAAQQRYRQALELKPDRAETHYLYAMALYGDFAGLYDYADEIPPDNAKTIFDEATTALKLKPTYADCYDVFARLCLNPGESVDEGLRLIDSAIRASPREHLFQLTRGALLYRKGDYVAARKTLTRLIEDDEKVPYKLRMGAQRILSKVERAEKKH